MSLPAPVSALIKTEQIKQVLGVVKAPEADATASVKQVLEPDFQERFDLIWLSEGALDDSEGQSDRLIAKCRDQLTSRVVVETSPHHQPTHDPHYLALGFVRCAVTEDHVYYLFDIKTYKPVPDWLNPRFWANPENWDKYRW